MKKRDGDKARKGKWQGEKRENRDKDREKEQRFDES